MWFSSLLASLVFFFKALLLVVITAVVVSAIITLLWNWQVVTITVLALPVLTFWQVFAIVGIIQFIRIKI